MSCEHLDYETVGKFPEFLYIHEDHGDGDRLANDVKCLECNEIGIEKYRFVETDIPHKENCEIDPANFEEIGQFPKNMSIDGEYFTNKIKCYECNKIGKMYYKFEEREWNND